MMGDGAISCSLESDGYCVIRFALRGVGRNNKRAAISSEIEGVHGAPNRHPHQYPRR